MSFFKKIGSLLSGGLLKQATGLIDNLVTSKEEKEQLRQAMKQLIFSHEEKIKQLANEDRASARDLQKSALGQSDLFAKRFIYYLAGFWSVSGIVYVFLATFTKVMNERTADTVIGFLMGTIVSTIINYFFGASEKTDLNKK